MNQNIIIFVILSIIQYSIDIYKHPCNTNIGNIYLLIHHFVSIYLYFGWLLFNPLYHLVACVIVLLHWVINNRCELTFMTNKKCGYKEDKLFYDFQQIIIQKEPTLAHRNIHWYLISFIIIYDIYLVIK